jgi:hypothetical protein
MKNLMSSLRQSFRRARAWTQHLLAGHADEQEIQPRVYWGDDVALALSNLAQETETRASGKVQVITLADFREAVGELWDKYQSRILLIAESTIGRMIGKGNTYIQQGEDAWILLFFGLNESDAQKRADAIAANLGEKLLGAQFSVEEPPLPATAKLDLADTLNADGSINMEALKASVSRIRQAQISKVVARSRTPPAARPGASTIAPVPRSHADKLRTFYRPAWRAETENVDTFFFRAAPQGGVNIYSDDAPPTGEATIIDLTKTAAADFVAMCDAGLQAKLSLPLPFEMLQGQAFPEIKRIISNLKQRDRLLRLRVEIVRIPANATADVLVAMREAFRPFVREVAFLVDLNVPNEQALVPDHIMLGADVTTAPATSDEAIFQSMLMFRQRAGRRGTYILGLHGRTQIVRAVSAGMAEIGGTTFMEDVKRLPHRISVLARDEIMTP